MGQAQINVRIRACSRTSIARTKQAALTHNVRGKELNIMDSASHNPVASLSSNPWVAEQQSVGPRVALIFKSIIVLLIIFLGFIKGKPC